MRFPTSAAITCAALFHTATALPVDSELVARGATAGIQMWSRPDFSGKFVHYAGSNIKFDTCYAITRDFPPGTSGGLSSVKADSKNQCYLYPNTACNPGSGSDNDRLGVLGSYYDLSGTEIGWGERAQSFKCSLCANCNN